MATATIYQAVNSGHTLHAFNGAYYVSAGDQNNIEVQRDSIYSAALIGISADGKGNVNDAFQKFVTFDVSSLSGATVSVADLVVTTSQLYAGTATWYCSAYAYSWVDGTDAQVRYNWRDASSQGLLPVYAATGGVTAGTNTDVTFAGTASLRTAIAAGSASLKMVISNDAFQYESNVTQLTQVYSANTNTTLTRRPRLIVTYTVAESTPFSYNLIVSPR
ncbi:MAG: hypothetical protein EBU08_22330, partial [Micrococcales bacterium]|nr:hypothetical protein [Micrococcales bacterium]